MWGLPNLAMLRQFVHKGGRVIVVGHGHCEWTMRCLSACSPYVTDWTAVSRHATMSFPDPTRVKVLHNGIDTDRCRPTRTRDEVRVEWGARPDEIMVGYVGRLSAEKNPLAVVDAAEALGPPYRAVLVGGGPGTDWFVGEARKRLPNTIHQPPVEQVGDVYRALDCFILASPSEGFSLALAEAWYCGCPTVATPVGATELTEEHGPLAVEVPINPTADQLAEAVRGAISPENRPVVERAAQVVATHYTATAMCRRWREYLTTPLNPIVGRRFVSSSPLSLMTR